MNAKKRLLHFNQTDKNANLFQKFRTVAIETKCAGGLRVKKVGGTQVLLINISQKCNSPLSMLPGSRNQGYEWKATNENDSGSQSIGRGLGLRIYPPGHGMKNLLNRVWLFQNRQMRCINAFKFGFVAMSPASNDNRDSRL
jgi:hypothetical protein